MGTQLSVKREWALTTQRYLLQTCSWTSASHNCEKSTSTVYKPFSLQHFVIAAGTHECTDSLLFRITTHMQYPWVGSLFFLKIPKNPVILFSSWSITFLNRTSYEKLGRGGGYITFAD